MRKNIKNTLGVFVFIVFWVAVIFTLIFCTGLFILYVVWKSAYQNDNVEIFSDIPICEGVYNHNHECVPNIGIAEFDYLIEDYECYLETMLCHKESRLLLSSTMIVGNDKDCNKRDYRDKILSVIEKKTKFKCKHVFTTKDLVNAVDVYIDLLCEDKSNIELRFVEKLNKDCNEDAYNKYVMSVIMGPM